MSVLKMIIADDRYYVSGEPHGSRAEWIYAACSRNPNSLEELDRLLPEFGSDRDLRAFFGGWMGSLDLEPVDAGLIIVDLAKKWIYAQDSYFGAHRRGSYNPRDEDDETIKYEFSKEWQFVAEPKWFRYLESLGLQPYGDLKGPAYDKTAYEGFSMDDLEVDDEPEAASRDDEDYDGEFSGVDVTEMNRITSLIDFDPQSVEEERDYQTLEHIARYDHLAAAAQRRVEKTQKEIASLKIELQAVENLRKRDSVPRWEIKRIALQARLGRHDQGISHWLEEHIEAAAMAAELRNLLVTDKGRQRLKQWEENEKNGGEDMELPF